MNPQVAPGSPGYESLLKLLAPAPIFYQPWWLDASAPGRWDYAVALRGDEVAAALPYAIEQGPFGQTWITMPPFTMTLGPWLRPSEAKYSNVLGEQKELMNELVDALPPHRYFAQNFHPSVTNWLPFMWRGFSQTTRYTYVLDDLTNVDALWDDLAHNVRKSIRKAEKQVRVVEGLGAERFWEMNAMTFARQGRTTPHGMDVVGRLWAACEERGAGKMLFAVDEQDQVHAATFIVWTEPACYYLMGGGDPELRSSGAGSLLMWEAIRHASAVSRRFDFEGSIIEPIERYFRSFGGRQMPYSRVTRDERGPAVSTWVRIARKLAGRRG